MAIIYEEDFSAGPSTWTSMNVYHTPTGVDIGTDPSDPLYPYIVDAESMKVASGQADWSGTYGDYATSGFVLRGFPAFDGTRARVQATYTPNATSLSLAAFHLPMIVVANGDLVLQVSVELIGADYELALRAYRWGGVETETVNYPFVAGVPYTFRLDWQCGSVVGDFDDVFADGWVRLYINDVLVLERLALAVYIDYTNANFVDMVWFGYYGLFGAIDNLLLETTVDEDPDDPPTPTPTTLPTPIVPTSEPCCGATPNPTPGDGPMPAGPVVVPISPVWVRSCAGGGVVPSAVDLTDAESWDF